MKKTFLMLCVFVLLWQGSLLAAEKPKKVDGMGQEYLSRQMYINIDIMKKYLELNLATIQANMYRDLGHQSEMKDAEQRKIAIKDKIDSLEKDKGNLKLDAAKYYKGNQPKAFLKAWNKNEMDYLRAIEVKPDEVK